MLLKFTLYFLNHNAFLEDLNYDVIHVAKRVTKWGGVFFIDILFGIFPMILISAVTFL